MALGLADISFGKVVESDVEFAARKTESVITKTSGSNIDVFGELGGGLSANFLKGGLFVFFGDSYTNVVGQVHFGLKGFFDHVILDEFLLSELLGLELFVLFLKFLNFFLFRLDHHVCGFS